jgi:hypothetical protein
LQDIEPEVRTIPEPPAGEQPDGTYTALITGVDAARRTITIDRCQRASGEEAVSLAEQADTAEGASRVLNRHRERLTIPVSRDAPFVLFYPGEAAKNVSPEESAAMSALTFDQFAEFYRTPNGKSVLSALGGWVSVSEGRVTSFVEPVDGTS